MIKSWKSKTLKKFHNKGSAKGIGALYAKVLASRLDRLEEAETIADMRLDGANLHRLNPPLQGHWSVIVKQPFNLTFRFENGHAYDVNFTDTHSGKKR